MKVGTDFSGDGLSPAGWAVWPALDSRTANRLRGNLPKAKISALGCYSPPRVLTNQDLEKMVDTTSQWIVERTGICERRIADPETATSDMAAEAARGAWGFDLVAACSGFVYGLTTGAHLVSSGAHRRVLVIGADTMSRIIDYTDRSTCILFGDGAGAMLLEASGESDNGAGFIDFLGEIDGSGGDFLKMPAGGSRLPASVETVQQRLHYVHQEGQQVFKYAVKKMFEVCRDLLQRNGFTGDDVTMMIPHQANRRIITAAAERLNIGPDRVLVNIDRYGNTTAATIPLATQDAIAQGRLKKGDLVLFAAVGAGYTVGASLWRWAY